MQVEFTTAEITSLVQPLRSAGTTDLVVKGIASLGRAEPGDLSFLGNSRYRAAVATTQASVVLLPEDFTGEPGRNQLFLFVESPSLALAKLCSRLEQALWPKPEPGIHPSASIAAGASIDPTATVGPLCVVESGARIGSRVHLEAHVVVGREAVIGSGSWLMPGVVVSAECTLGSRVQVQPGAVIGSDGFGYEFVSGRHEKIPQIGTVVIGDDVEIGANSTIDRARFSRTVIGDGTKIDNLVQVGHNVVIGKHCIICSQTGISGSTTLEDYVVLGGQVGLAGHITLGKGSKVGAQAGVPADLAPGVQVWGSPSLPLMLEQKFAILKARLPELFKRVQVLEDRRS